MFTLRKKEEKDVWCVVFQLLSKGSVSVLAKMLCFMAALICTQSVPHRLQYRRSPGWSFPLLANSLQLERLAYGSSKDSVSVLLAPQAS